MTYSIAATMRRLFAPQHKLSCSWLVWRRLVKQLRQRGLNRTRESGAFLLGYTEYDKVRIVDFILYDDLDPNALDTGIVRFNGRYFGELWAQCKERRLTVVADIHVHPGGSGQSISDRNHPMISKAGHLALILPRFAAVPQRRADIGIYTYLGDKNWQTIAQDERDAFFHIGF